MAKMKALVCRECGKEYPPKAIHVCEMCFGPLEVKYNYDEIKRTISRKKIEQGGLFRKNGRHPAVEPKNAAMHQRFPGEETGVIDEELRRKVIHSRR